ncbi:MAG: fructose-bisphosphatase class II, partial [Candidatus Omnitrophica bacterium]|nr:fructose-bisphosphatase class II [Candidatus Omnitrophota bacterium]
LKVLAKYEKPEGELGLILKKTEGSQQKAEKIELEVKRVAAEVDRLLRRPVTGTPRNDAIASPAIVILRGAKNLGINFAKQSQVEFQGKKQLYQTSQLSAEDYSLYLREIIERNHLPIKLSLTLHQEAEEARCLRDLEGTKVYEEYEKYAEKVITREIASSLKSALRNDVITSKAKQSQVFKLYEQSKELRLLSKLAKLELSREDWGKIKTIWTEDASFARDQQGRQNQMPDQFRLKIWRGTRSFYQSPFGGFAGQQAHANMNNITKAPPTANFIESGSLESQTETTETPKRISVNRNNDLATESRRYGSSMPKILSSNKRRVKNKIHIFYDLNKYSANAAFYINAEAREQAFLSKVTGDREWGMERNQSPTPNLRPLILVAGGFHTQGLITKLKAQGISYAVVMPHIEKLPEVSVYKAQMQGEVSWRSYFQVKDGKINLYEAFVRATRDKLLKLDVRSSKLEETDKDQPVQLPTSNFQLLKSWRDQIILDLAKQGKIETASDYTSFLDEISQGSGFRVRDLDPEWFSNVENFFSGLHQLETSHQLNPQSIAGLFKPSTITVMPVGAQLADGQFQRVRPAHLGIFEPSNLKYRSELRNDWHMIDMKKKSLKDYGINLRDFSLTPEKIEFISVSGSPKPPLLTSLKSRLATQMVFAQAIASGWFAGMGEGKSKEVQEIIKMEADGIAVSLGDVSFQLLANISGARIIMAGNEGKRDGSAFIEILKIYDPQGSVKFTGQTFLVINDSVEGTQNLLTGHPGAWSFIALYDAGNIFSTDIYRASMVYRAKKRAKGLDPLIFGKNTVLKNLKLIAQADEINVGNVDSLKLTREFISWLGTKHIQLLDRKRHEAILAQLKELEKHGLTFETVEDGDFAPMVLQAAFGVLRANGRKVITMGAGGANEHLAGMTAAYLSKPDAEGRKGYGVSRFIRHENLNPDLSNAAVLHESEIYELAVINLKIESSGLPVRKAPDDPAQITAIQTEIELIAGKPVIAAASITGARAFDLEKYRNDVPPIEYVEEQDGSGKCTVHGFLVDDYGDAYLLRATFSTPRFFGTRFQLFNANSHALSGAIIHPLIKKMEEILTQLSDAEFQEGHDKVLEQFRRIETLLMNGEQDPNWKLEWLSDIQKHQMADLINGLSAMDESAVFRERVEAVRGSFAVIAKDVSNKIMGEPQVLWNDHDRRLIARRARSEVRADLKSDLPPLQKWFGEWNEPMQPSKPFHQKGSFEKDPPSSRFSPRSEVRSSWGWSGGLVINAGSGGPEINFHQVIKSWPKAAQDSLKSQTEEILALADQYFQVRRSWWIAGILGGIIFSWPLYKNHSVGWILLAWSYLAPWAILRFPLAKDRGDHGISLVGKVPRDNEAATSRALSVNPRSELRLDSLDAQASSSAALPAAPNGEMNVHDFIRAFKLGKISPHAVVEVRTYLRHDMPEEIERWHFDKDQEPAVLEGWDFRGVQPYKFYFPFSSIATVKVLDFDAKRSELRMFERESRVAVADYFSPRTGQPHLPNLYDRLPISVSTLPGPQQISIANFEPENDRPMPVVDVASKPIGQDVPARTPLFSTSSSAGSHRYTGGDGETPVRRELGLVEAGWHTGYTPGWQAALDPDEFPAQSDYFTGEEPWSSRSELRSDPETLGETNGNVDPNPEALKNSHIQFVNSLFLSNSDDLERRIWNILIRPDSLEVLQAFSEIDLSAVSNMKKSVEQVKIVLNREFKERGSQMQPLMLGKSANGSNWAVKLFEWAVFAVVEFLQGLIKNKKNPIVQQIQKKVTQLEVKLEGEIQAEEARVEAAKKALKAATIGGVTFVQGGVSLDRNAGNLKLDPDSAKRVWDNFNRIRTKMGDAGSPLAIQGAEWFSDLLDAWLIRAVVLWENHSVMSSRKRALLSNGNGSAVSAGSEAPVDPVKKAQMTEAYFKTLISMMLVWLLDANTPAEIEQHAVQFYLLAHSNALTLDAMQNIGIPVIQDYTAANYMFDDEGRIRGAFGINPPTKKIRTVFADQLGESWSRLGGLSAKLRTIAVTAHQKEFMNWITRYISREQFEEGIELALISDPASLLRAEQEIRTQINPENPAHRFAAFWQFMAGNPKVAQEFRGSLSTRYVLVDDPEQTVDRDVREARIRKFDGNLYQLFVILLQEGFAKRQTDENHLDLQVLHAEFLDSRIWEGSGIINTLGKRHFEVDLHGVNFSREERSEVRAGSRAAQQKENDLKVESLNKQWPFRSEMRMKIHKPSFRLRRQESGYRGNLLMAGMGVTFLSFLVVIPTIKYLSWHHWIKKHPILGLMSLGIALIIYFGVIWALTFCGLSSHYSAGIKAIKKKLREINRSGKGVFSPLDDIEELVDGPHVKIIWGNIPADTLRTAQQAGRKHGFDIRLIPGGHQVVFTREVNTLNPGRRYPSGSHTDSAAFDIQITPRENEGSAPPRPSRSEVRSHTLLKTTGELKELRSIELNPTPKAANRPQDVIEFRPFAKKTGTGFLHGIFDDQGNSNPIPKNTYYGAPVPRNSNPKAVDALVSALQPGHWPTSGESNQMGALTYHAIKEHGIPGLETAAMHLLEQITLQTAQDRALQGMKAIRQIKETNEIQFALGEENVGRFGSAEAYVKELVRAAEALAGASPLWRLRLLIDPNLSKGHPLRGELEGVLARLDVNKHSHLMKVTNSRSEIRLAHVSQAFRPDGNLHTILVGAVPRKSTQNFFDGVRYANGMPIRSELRTILDQAVGAAALLSRPVVDLPWAVRSENRFQAINEDSFQAGVSLLTAMMLTQRKATSASA